MPHLLLQEQQIMKPLQVHAGKGVTQCIILPFGQTGLLTEHPPETVPIPGGNRGIRVVQYLIQQGSGTSAQRDSPGATGLAIATFNVDNLFFLVDISPAKTPHFSRADTTPQHQSEGGIHTM